MAVMEDVTRQSLNDEESEAVIRHIKMVSISLYSSYYISNMCVSGLYEPRHIISNNVAF